MTSTAYLAQLGIPFGGVGGRQPGGAARDVLGWAVCPVLHSNDALNVNSKWFQVDLE
jgi:hypothetical protein